MTLLREHRGLLTPTQAIIATLTDLGWTPRSIARYLALNTATVRNHLDAAAERIATLKQEGK